MKNIYKLSIIALATLSIVACSQQEVNDDPVKEDVTKENTDVKGYSFAVSALGTKTQLDGTTQNGVLWSEGDVIGVVKEGETEVYEFTATSIEDDGASAIFSSSDFTVSEDENGTKAYVIYPYSEDVTFADGAFTTTLSTEQTAVEGNIPENTAITQGVATLKYNDRPDVSMFNACSVLKFKFGSDPSEVNSVTFTATKLAGSGTLSATGATGSLFTPSAEEATTVTLTGEFNYSEEKEIYYYVVVAPGTYSDLTVKALDEEGNALYSKTIEKDGGVTFKSKVYKVGTINMPEWKLVTEKDEFTEGTYIIVYPASDGTNYVFSWANACTNASEVQSEYKDYGFNQFNSTTANAIYTKLLDGNFIEYTDGEAGAEYFAHSDDLDAASFEISELNDDDRYNNDPCYTTTFSDQYSLQFNDITASLDNKYAKVYARPQDKSAIELGLNFKEGKDITVKQFIDKYVEEETYRAKLYKVVNEIAFFKNRGITLDKDIFEILEENYETVCGTVAEPQFGPIYFNTTRNGFCMNLELDIDAKFKEVFALVETFIGRNYEHFTSLQSLAIDTIKQKYGEKAAALVSELYANIDENGWRHLEQIVELVEEKDPLFTKYYAKVKTVVDKFNADESEMASIYVYKKITSE